MTLVGSLGSVLFKAYAVNKTKKYLLSGFMLYGLGALLNIYLLRKLPYTIVVPANALTFIWTLMFAKWIFREHISVHKIVGIFVIILGLILLVL
jgi:drug/metabolite transporter (DMT)-like permease